jgi:protein SCO1
MEDGPPGLLLEVNRYKQKRSNPMRRKSWVSLAVAVVLVLTGMFFISGSPPAAAAYDASRYGPNYFPNTVLTTHEGKTVHFYDDVLKGKISVIYLMYTTCEYMCPLETARLVQVQKILGDRAGKDIFFYGISLDPKHDTPQALKAYAEKYHVGPGWTFLTGKAEDIELISRKLGLYSDPDPSNKDGHTPIVLLANEVTGQFIWNSALDNPRFLATTIGDYLDNFKNSKPGKSYAEARPFHVGKGQYVFARHCAACHTIGHGDSIGPDLFGVTSSRDPKWLRREIAQPETLLKEKDPMKQALFNKYKHVVMPDLNILDEDVDALIAFLKEQSAIPDKKSGGDNPQSQNSQLGGSSATGQSKTQR